MRNFLKAHVCIGLLFIMQLSFAQVDTSHWQNLADRNKEVFKLLDQNLDSAIALSNALVESAEPPYDTVIYSKILMYNGHALSDKGLYEKANERYLEVLRLRELLSDKSKVASAYHSVANINYQLKDYQNTIHYALKAIESYSLEPDNFKQVANCYNLIGVTYYDRDLNDSALYYYDLGIGILDQNENSQASDYQFLYDNKGNTLIWTEDYEAGLPILKKNIALYKEQSNFFNLSWVYTQLVRTYIKLENIDSATHYTQLLSEIPMNAMSLEMNKDVLYFKSLMAIRSNNLDSLEAFFNSFYILSDSLVTEKTNANIKDSQTKYEVEKKEAALMLAKEAADKLDAESKAKSRLLWLTAAVLLILLLTGAIIYRNFRSKAKLNALALEVKDTKIDELLSNQESEVYASILKGQEQERERIAQDLHDRLGGTLAALKLSLRKPENSVQEEDMAIIDTAVNEVRSISHNLSTGLVYKYGLNTAVDQLFRSLQNSKGMQFNLYLHPDIGKLGQALGIELYRVVQELVSNTLKHAKASEVSLQTNFIEDKFNLIYEDNGVGFDPDNIKGGIGLVNVRRRVEKIGGQFHIDAQKGRGSNFIIEIKTSN